MLGEISKQRTASALCESDGELLVMTDDKVKQLYYQNPRFGFSLVQLITRRLIENCEAAEKSSERWPEPQRPRIRAAV